MNNEEKILSLLEKMYLDLQDTKKEMREGFKAVNERINNVETGLRAEIREVKNTVIRMENDHGQKLNALFDGYKQNSDKLNA